MDEGKSDSLGKRGDAEMKLVALVRAAIGSLVCLIVVSASAALAAQADDGSTSSANPSSEKPPSATQSETEAKTPYSGPPTWYSQTRVSTEYGIVLTHYWSKGPKFRVQTMLAGHPVTTIVDGPFYYVYDAILGRGAAIERNTTAIAEDATRGRPFGREQEDLLASGGELVSDGQVGFDVYQLTNENGRRRVIVTDSVPALPVRVETFVRASATKGVLEYFGWQRNLAIEDSFFTPPPTINFQRLTYLEYTQRVGREAIGPAPVYYRDLLHGKKRFAE
jgi:hypothetical protein